MGLGLACAAMVGLFLCSAEPSLSQSGWSPRVDCGQDENVQGPLVKEAEAKRFLVRRVEITGNTTIRHNEFVKRLRGLNEGDIFTKQSFERAVQRIAKMRAIYPITVSDVEIRLDRSSGDVDIIVCVKERSK